MSNEAPRDQNINVRVSSELKEKTRKAAEKEGRSMSNYVEWVLRKALESDD